MRARQPSWLKRKIPFSKEINRTKRILAELGLNTVCQSANCPNIGECFAGKTATFMILGNICTRNCRFCAITSGQPEEVNSEEAKNIAEAAVLLGLKHVVITSVTRDDLADGGVSHFIAVIDELTSANPAATIEILTPDFLGRKALLEKIATAPWHVFNHNVETVPRLYEKVRPGADYWRSIQVLAEIKSQRPNSLTKSGLMLGLGEKQEEIVAVMEDLQRVGCDFLTIGQYLQPTLKHLPVLEYIEPHMFARYQKIGEGMGFKGVAAGPFVRSSYKAAQLLADNDIYRRKTPDLS